MGGRRRDTGPDDGVVVLGVGERQHVGQAKTSARPVQSRLFTEKRDLGVPGICTHVYMLILPDFLPVAHGWGPVKQEIFTET